MYFDYSSIVALISLLFLPGIFIVTHLFSGKISKTEQLCLVVLISIGINSITLFYLAIFNQISTINILTLCIVVNIIVFVYTIKTTSIIFRRIILSLNRMAFRSFLQNIKHICSHIKLDWKFLVEIYIFIILVFEFYLAIILPFTAWDVIACFGTWTSQILTHNGLDNIGRGYPQLASLLRVWIYQLSGQRYEQFAHVLYPIFGSITLYYTYLLAKKIGTEGIFAILFLFLTPWFLMHFNAGYAEIIVTAFFISSVYYAIKAIENEVNIKYFLISCFIGGLAAFAKPQGTYIFLALPLGYLCSAYFINKFNTKKVLKIGLASLGVILIGGQWWIRNLLINPNYFFGTISARSQSPFLSGIFGQDYSNILMRPIILAQHTVANTPRILILIYLIGFVYLIAQLLQKTKRTEYIFLSIFILPYMVIWPFILSQVDDLVYILPFLAILSSKAILDTLCSVVNYFKQGFKFSHMMEKAWGGKIIKILQIILIIVILFNPFINSLSIAFQGDSFGTKPTPKFWAITHPFSSDKEKRTMFLGEPFAETVDFLNNNKDIQKSKIIVVDPRMGALVNNATLCFGRPKNLSELSDADYIVVMHDWSACKFNEYWWKDSEVRKSIQSINSPFTPVFKSGESIVYKINKTSIKNCVNTNIGKSKAHPLSAPFLLKGYSQRDEIYTEVEDFCGITNADEGWGVAASLFQGESYRVAFSKTSACSGKTLYSTLNTSSGDYYLWVRHAIWHFSKNDYNITIDQYPTQRVSCSAGNESRLEWICIGKFSLNQSIHKISFTTTGNHNWVGIDMILLITNQSYTPHENKRSYNINPWGKPHYRIGEQGYYIWQDEHGWHIRWTSDANKKFMGQITTDNTFTNITKHDFELDDKITWDNNTIWFEGFAKDDEDGIDFTTMDKRITFDINICGNKNL